MKRLLSAVAAAVILALSLCSCGQTDGTEIQPVSAASESAVVRGGEEMSGIVVYENIKVTIFRSGNYFSVRFPDDTGKGWQRINCGLPDEVKLEDGGFGTLTTDVKYTFGGDRGKAFEFENATGFEQITADEARKTIGFEDYAPTPEDRYDMYYNEVQVCSADGKEYLLMRADDGVHVYLDGKPFAVYDSPFEMEAALGLPHPVLGGDIRRDEVGGVDMLVFRCGNIYLSYSTDICLNERWTPILDEDLNNLPTGFSLEDGEMAEIKNADIVIVNGGDGKYLNAPMLTAPAEAVKKGYYEAMHGLAAQWSGEDHASDKDGGFWEYTPEDSDSDYLIILVDGNYLLYHDNGKEQYLKNVYFIADDVSKAIEDLPQK